METTKERHAIIQECYKDVARYLRKFGLPQEDYEEAIQDTFVEAFSQAHTLRDTKKVQNWLIKIARTKGLKHRRKCFVLTTIECAFKEDVVQLDCENTYEEDLLEELVAKTDTSTLVACMNKLKPKERAVLIHQYVYEEKLKDIAIIIGESLTNTKTISRRAKAKLKNYLIDGGYEHGK